jgi:hypothetical protein
MSVMSSSLAVSSVLFVRQEKSSKVNGSGQSATGGEIHDVRLRVGGELT